MSYEEALKATPAPDANSLAQLKGKHELAQQNLEKREALEAEIKKLNETDIPNAQKAVEARQKQIDKTIEEIKTLQDQLKNAKAKLQEIQDAQTDKALNKLDGNKCSRIDKKEYEAKFKTRDNNAITSDFPDGQNPTFTKADLQRAINDYRLAPDDQKNVYKERFNKIYKYLLNNDSDAIRNMKPDFDAINA